MKTNEKVSNYIKLCSEWAEKFLQMDKEELKKRLPELKEEDGYLKITHFGVPFGIRLDDGRIDCLDGKGEANATEMLISTPFSAMSRKMLPSWTSGCRLRIFVMRDLLGLHTRSV